MGEVFEPPYLAEGSGHAKAGKDRTVPSFVVSLLFHGGVAVAIATVVTTQLPEKKGGLQVPVAVDFESAKAPAQAVTVAEPPAPVAKPPPVEKVVKNEVQAVALRTEPTPQIAPVEEVTPPSEDVSQSDLNALAPVTEAPAEPKAPEKIQETAAAPERAESAQKSDEKSESKKLTAPAPITAVAPEAVAQNEKPVAPVTAPADEPPQPSTDKKATATAGPAAEPVGAKSAEIAEEVTAAPLPPLAELQQPVVRDVSQLRQLPGNRPPPYPELSRLKRQSGEVVLDYYVTSRGEVTDLKVLQSSGYQELDNSAVTAVSQYRFYPGQEGQTRHSVLYNLRGQVKQLPSRLRAAGSTN